MTRSSRFAVVVLVLTSGVTACDDAPRRAVPSPAPSSPSSPSSTGASTAPRPDPALAATIADPDAYLTDFAATTDGSEAAVWTLDGVGNVLAVRRADTDVVTLRDVTPGLGGLASVAGGWRAVRDSGARVSIDLDARLTRDPSPPQHPYTFVTPDGVTVRAVAVGRSVVVRRRGPGDASTAELAHGRRVAVGAMGGAGDTVAVVLLRYVPTRNRVETVNTGVAVSHDAGRTWRTVPIDDLGPSTVVVTASGTVVVGTYPFLRTVRSGALRSYRIEKAGALSVNGDTLYVAGEQRVEVSTDQGDTWSKVTPPGR